jgi:DNA-binding SARP family transcriptional activator/tetratricopeptide (TPR) repeat protein
MNELLTLGRVRLVADGVDSASGTMQPKRIGLLAYLALASAEAPVRRDTLLALFWPELGESEARPALRQALYYLRRALGDDVIVTASDELALRPESLRCDAVEFERLAANGEPQAAIDLYRGDFLDGFHIDDVSPELEEWVWRTRARLKRRASAVAWAASDAAAATGNAAQAIELGRRACDIEPDQETGWRRLMALQEGVGDRAGALRTYGELADRLARDYESRPAPETTALAESIRNGDRAAPQRGVERQAVADDSATEPPNAVARPRFGGTRVLVGTLAVFAVAIGVAAVAFTRSRNETSATSLVGSGTLAAKDRVVVADFENLVGDSLLAAGITEAFRIDLSQSPLVRVLSAGQLAGSLQRMERAPDTVLTNALAREVAEREGAKAVVTGSIAAVGGAYTVNVRLVATEDAEVLAAFRETATDSSALLDAVERASHSLRRRIGESLSSLRALPPLTQVTTRSLTALRKFTEANRLSLVGQRDRAIALWQEAAAIDSTFAAAYVGLAHTYAAMGELGRGAEALSRAVAHQARLPFEERTFTVGSYAYSRGDYETAVDTYGRFLERYPDDIRALNNLALIHRDQRRFAVAESLFARATRVDTTIANLYFGLHSTQLLQGRFRESRATLDEIGRRFPGNPVLLTVEMQDASAQHHWDEAERLAETQIAASTNDSLALIDPYEALAGLVMAQGRLDEAEGLWRKQLALSAATRSYGRHLFGLLQLAQLELRHRRAPARAAALVDSALAGLPLDSVLPADRPYDELARFQAQVGRLTQARELMMAAERNDSNLGRSRRPDRAWTKGVIALAAGDARLAEDELREAADRLVCTVCALPDLARAYEATGKPAAAVVVYERYLAMPWYWRYETDAQELAWVMVRLAGLYDGRGEVAKASAMRARLIQLWRQADPELQPVVAEARRRVAATQP